MLGYLDALIQALSVRDRAEADRLLAHPLARLLPDGVRDEAMALASGAADPLAAPLHALMLRRQTAELLRDTAGIAEIADMAAPETRPTVLAPPPSTRRTIRHQQMELPLSA